MVAQIATDRVIIVEMPEYVELRFGNNFLPLELWLRRFVFIGDHVRYRKGGLSGPGTKGSCDVISEAAARAHVVPAF